MLLFYGRRREEEKTGIAVLALIDSFGKILTLYIL
jgi:hypothetical protein